MIRLPPDLARLLEEGGTLVVPSRQRAHAVRLAHAAAQLQAGRRVWPTPDVLPMQAWLMREVERLAALGAQPLPRLLSRAEEWLIWRECAASASHDLDLLSAAAVADGLQGASALAAEWDIDLSRRQQMLGAEAQLLFDAERAVDARCSALHAGRLQSFSGQLPAADPAQVVFRGFTMPSSRLRGLGVASSATPAAKQHGTAPRAVLAADELEELELIAAWCRSKIDEQPDTRILVLLSGDPGARERLAALVRQAIDPRAWIQSASASGTLTAGSDPRAAGSDPRAAGSDPHAAGSEPRAAGSGPHAAGPHAAPLDGLAIIEGGEPFCDAPVVAHALESLAWAAGEPADFSRVSEWLRAPFWETPTESDRARLDLWLRQSGRPGDGQIDCLALLGEAPAPLHAATRELSQRLQHAAGILQAERLSPRQWSERLRAALGAMGWPGGHRRNSREEQTLMRFQELLDEFGQLTASSGAMARQEAIRLFGELARATAFRPADDDAVVTISPRLIEPVVQYDAIWVAGLSADVFPQPVQPDPFVPLGLQRMAGVPAASAATRLQEAHGLLASWRAATRDLVLSVPRRCQDLELMPSPLLAPHLGAAPTSGAPAPPVAWLPERLHRAGQLEARSDWLGRAWPAADPLPGTRALELQNLCPFRAYAELRLGSSELCAPEPGVAAELRGKLVHAALEKLWRKLEDSQTLAQLDGPQLRLLIEQAVDGAAAAVLGPQAAQPAERTPLLARECSRTVRLIEKLCELERKRPTFRVAGAELERQITLAGARVAVRIDRLDALPSGGQVILDYKTGRHVSAEWYDPRPSHPQLLAYLAAVGSDAVAMATVSLTAREVRFEGVGVSSSLLPKLKAVQGTSTGARTAWQVRTQEWRDCVERLATEFVQGHAQLDPKPGACDYCHAASICRISDRGVFAIAEVRGDLPVLPDE